MPSSNEQLDLVIQSHHDKYCDGVVVSRDPHCYALITIRHKNPPPLIFPPINHENLHVSTYHHEYHQNNIIPPSSESSQSESDSETTTSSVSSFSPPSSPDSSSTPRRLQVVKATGRINFVEMLVMKVVRLVKLVWGNLVKWRGISFNFRAVLFVASVLYFRERRRRHVDAAKQKDEKISQLLDQISQMNQMLLDCQRAGTSTTTALIGPGMNITRP